MAPPPPARKRPRAELDRHLAGSARLAALRAELDRLGLAAFLVPTDDPHGSEYVGAHFERRAFISGFCGSSGTAVVTAHTALLWTDGRYFLQAQQELFDGWSLMKDRLPETIPIGKWLADNLPEGAVVGFDPFVVSSSEVMQLRASLEAAAKTLRPVTPINPIDVIWGDARPRPSGAKVRSLSDEVAGKSVADKLHAVARAITAAGADTLVVSALDEVAWLLNVRGADIPFCPVAYAYATVHVAHHISLNSTPLRRARSDKEDEEADDTLMQEPADVRVCWYIDEAKVDPPVLLAVRASAGARARVELKPYASLPLSLKAEVAVGRKLAVPPSSSEALHTLVPASHKLTPPSPITLLKARKNFREIAGIVEAHRRDGRALCRFLHWLDATKGGSALCAQFGSKAVEYFDEAGAADALESFRKLEEDYIGPSFETIAAYAGNGAIIHYKPEVGSCARLGDSALFLCDSGGQYACGGTTDVTRTVHLNPLAATEHERRCFTRVLQAHIAVDTAVFPEGVTGYQLDSLARAPLWRAGLDYRHGTGHGVGHYLNVHEGPQALSRTRISANDHAFEIGMTLSNEPGVCARAAPRRAPPRALRARRASACLPCRADGALASARPSSAARRRVPSLAVPRAPAGPVGPGRSQPRPCPPHALRLPAPRPLCAG